MKLYFEQVGIVKGCIENVTENCAADKRIVTQLEYVGKPNLKKFTPKMKEALIIIAKKVICDEIKHNIKNIRPSFDLEKGLSLKVNTLLEAMYYSLLLNYKQGQGYRRCTRCYEYFLMSLTDNKRKILAAERIIIRRTLNRPTLINRVSLDFTISKEHLIASS